MHRIFILTLLLMFSVQSIASAMQHDCGAMMGNGVDASRGGADTSHAMGMHHDMVMDMDMGMDMPHEMHADMPCCDGANSVAGAPAAGAAEQASHCQLSCSLGACSAPVAMPAALLPLEFTLLHPESIRSPIDRPTTSHTSLFRPPIAA
ncbi:hypothetical protein Maes01_01218 [Microbulbifer aestuariivivens]|uniref:CopL family metal-binding regulatory protein n=1 Tax=Microbulbifer aestuariivivens TaxID=1908308 RepID=A0ABP9WQF8_9GAMM